MTALTMLLALTALQTDTVTVTAGEVLSRSRDQSPAVHAAARRMEAASFTRRAAGRWANPVVSAVAENIGATEAVTGISGIKGIEGQLVLTQPLALGGDIGASVDAANASSLVAEARYALTTAETELEAAVALAQLRRGRAIVRNAVQEVASLDLLVNALDLRVAAGRSPLGDAARARLALGQAASRLARSEAASAHSNARLARLLGLPPATIVLITIGRCEAPPEAPQSEGFPADVLVAEQGVALGVAARSYEHANRVPDLFPQVGWKRTAGVSGLYLGMSLAVPILNGGGPNVEAAESETSAREVELAATKMFIAERAVAAQAELEALDRAGARFDARWVAALDQSLMAAEANYDLGEGTITELLDHRRARLAALDDFALWQAERRVARAQVARWTGTRLSGAAFCEEREVGN
jgi:outer membrane protein TolC